MLTELMLAIGGTGVGLLIGYAMGRRGIRQGGSARPELAHLRGKGAQRPPTIGFPRGPIPTNRSASPIAWPPSTSPVNEMPNQEPSHAANVEPTGEPNSESEVGLKVGLNVGPPTESPSSDTWQLAQLHQEHVTLQIQIDELTDQVQRATDERDRAQSRADRTLSDVDLLRTLLAQQEAVIASLERERAELRERIDRAESSSS